jgi:hypothetical protein
MSIPLERLYHYIESVAEKIHGDRVIIYLFQPHGSKNIENLSFFRKYTWEEYCSFPQMYCNDQEPLDYDFYQNTQLDLTHKENQNFIKMLEQENIILPKKNLRNRHIPGFVSGVYDKVLLLHSEQRSDDVRKYIENDYITVYYWNHALLSRDWFRYAQHQDIKKISNPTKFLIYNRAWGGTREYRLKFTDCLIENNLVDQCVSWFNPVDPESEIHYHDHNYKNLLWKPKHCLENYFFPKNISSSSSADFDLNDYSQTDFEVVLETLFDDHRLHLTEKILRPIACRQPFLLMGTHGSLEYLRSYGFQTFDGIIDESYDLIIDPEKRMLAVIDSMKQIVAWTDKVKNQNIKKIQKIVEHNHNHFFSEQFLNLILEELHTNLGWSLKELEETNTSSIWINRRKEWSQKLQLKKYITDVFPYRDRQALARVLSRARKYYVRSLSSVTNNK